MTHEALTEAAARPADRPGAVTEEIWSEAAGHYEERQLGAPMLMAAITDFFNRINTPRATGGCTGVMAITGRLPGKVALVTGGSRGMGPKSSTLGRIGEPADTAAVVAFLASADAGFVTGQVIYAAGGQRGPVAIAR